MVTGIFAKNKYTHWVSNLWDYNEKDIKDWFDENNGYINQFLSEKRRFYSKLNQGYQNKHCVKYRNFT